MKLWQADARAANIAIATVSTVPTNTDALSLSPLGNTRADGIHKTRDFVSGDSRILGKGERSLFVRLSLLSSACLNPDPHHSGAEFRNLALDYFKKDLSPCPLAPHASSAYLYVTTAADKEFRAHLPLAAEPAAARSSCVTHRTTAITWGMQTVFDAAGGHDGMCRLAAAWHRRVMADNVVAHAFSRFHPSSGQLAAYWAEALGGPPTYSESYGDETFVVRMRQTACTMKWTSARSHASTKLWPM